MISQKIEEILKKNGYVYMVCPIPYGITIRCLHLVINIYDHKNKYFFQGKNDILKKLIKEELEKCL